MNRLPDAEKTPSPRVILMDGGLGESLHPLALAWAGLGQSLALVGSSEGFSLAIFDLQLAIERAGGICLALEGGDSPEGLSAALGRVVDALGGIDLIVVSDAVRAADLLVAMDNLPRRIRPGWVLTGSAPQGECLATLPLGPRVAQVLTIHGDPGNVARQALLS